MSIEAIIKRLERFDPGKVVTFNPNDPLSLKPLLDETIKDAKFLLEQNQQLVEALERADKAFQRLSTGDFNAPMELSQIEAYQAYAASAHQWLQAYKLLERKEK